MKTTGITCRRGSCARITRHPTGFCHDHRGQTGASSTIGYAPPPTAPQDPKNPFVLHGGDGSTTEQWSDEDGLTHRTDGPAEIEYDPLGGLASERWYEHGSNHRLGGPAEVYYRPRGEVSQERWRLVGMLHRIDGPASRDYERDGSVKSEAWHFRRQKYPDAATFAREIAAIYSEEVIRDDLRHSVHADLVADGADPYRVLEGIGAGISTAEGMAEYLGGTPAEWIRSYESAQS